MLLGLSVYYSAGPLGNDCVVLLASDRRRTAVHPVSSYSTVRKEIFLRIPNFWLARELGICSMLGRSKDKLRKSRLLGNPLRSLLRMDSSRPHSIGHFGEQMFTKSVF